MSYNIKSFVEIQYQAVNLLFLVYATTWILQGCNQLSFTTMAFPKPMLKVIQNVVLIQMSSDVTRDDVF